MENILLHMFTRRDVRRTSRNLTARTTLLVVIFLWTALCCSAAEEKRAAKFAEEISFISKNEGQIISKNFLLGDPAFTSLTIDAAANVDPCISYLMSDGHSHQERMIAILSMHRLSASEYIGFLKGILKLYDENKISSNELSLAVIPTYEFSITLIQHYNEDDVQGILKDILKRTNLSAATRSAIVDILSGKALNDEILFHRDCCTAKNKN